jgi:16S rRNA processing protein RimM
MGRGRMIPIGRIVGVHGLHGIVKVRSYAESDAFFQPGRRITLKDEAGCIRYQDIRWSQTRLKRILLAFRGVDNRSQAGEMVGSELLIERSALPEPEDGSFYWFDLIGLAVYTLEGDYLGRLDAVMPTGSNDVYIVKNRKDGREIETLIPALESVVVEIDLDGGAMRVDLPEGL